MILNLNDSHLERASKIYSEPYPGVIELEDIIDEESRKEIVNELKQKNEFLVNKDANFKNGVKQRMSTVYFERETLPDLADSYPVVSQVHKEFQSWYKRLAANHFLHSVGINSVGIHKYEKGNIGITPHQDNFSSINAVSILVVDGEAPFYTCAHRNSEIKNFFPNKPGSLIVLRAHRYKLEEGVRPFHAVGKVKSERYVICMREHVNVDKEYFPLNFTG